ncbi:hypothetical protein NIES2109_22780 [Nostoc sp. HK-01]|nr:hypothetical protein NIES2109_22780 [Nostoc sp. HK-01]
MPTINPPLTKSCFTNGADLNECLIQYFAGTLDYFTDLSRLWLPPALLHPSNTLWGLLDSELMYEAIDKLSYLHRAIITQEYRPSEETQAYINDCYVLTSSNLQLDDWQSNELRLAIYSLSEIVLDLL